MDDLQGARELLESALAAFQAALFANHPRIQIVRDHLAVVNQAIDDAANDPS